VYILWKNQSPKKKKILRRRWGERTLTFVLAGFGFVAALAWNDAIQALVRIIFGDQPESILAKFFYAALITVAATVVSIRLSRLTSKE